MTQLDFSDYGEQPAVRASDPTTSQIAALAAGRARGKARVARALYEHGTLHDEAIAEVTGMSKASTSKRRGDLVKLGLAEPVMLHGAPIITRTRADFPAQVWRLTVRGHEIAVDLEPLVARVRTVTLAAAELQAVIDLIEAGLTSDAIDQLERWKP